MSKRSGGMYVREAMCSRPAAFVCSFFILSALLSAIAVVPGDDIKIIYALLAVAALLLLVFAVIMIVAAAISSRSGQKNVFFLRTVAFMMLFAAIGTVLSSVFYGVFPRKTVSDYCGEEIKISFTVEECSYYSEYGASYLVTITEHGDEKVSIPATLVCDGSRDMSVGESASAFCDISASEIYDSTLVSLLSFSSEGRYLTADAGENKFTDRKESGERTLYHLRTSLAADISVRLGREEGGLVSALLLGDRSELTARISSDFRLLGISHIIAISGMHLSLMMIAVGFLLKRLRVPAIVRAILVVLLALFYAALTGFSPSVVRAAVMLLIARSAPLFGRRGDPVTSLCITVFLMALVTPSAITDVGLLLSFSATLGIVTLGVRFQKSLDALCERWEKRFSGDYKKNEIGDIGEIISAKATNDKAESVQSFADKLACLCIGIFSYFVSIALMSIAATLFTLPLVMVLFGSMSVIFLPANLLFVPLSTVLLVASPFVLLPAPIALPVYGLVADMSRAVILLSRRMASLAGDVMFVNPFETVVTLAAVSTVFLLLRCALVKSRKAYVIGLRRASALTVVFTAIATVAAFLSSSALYGYFWYNSTSVSYITSGSDECILLRDGSDDVLIDISCGSKVVMRAAARAAENGTPDIIVLTHVRDLHLTVYKTLFVQMYPEVLYLPMPTDDDERYLTESISALAAESDTEVIFYSPGEGLTFSDYRFTLTEYTVPKGETHPVICFELSPIDGGETLSYIGGDFRSCLHEHGRVSFMSMTSPDHLIIGGHDPTAEREIGNFGYDSETVLFGSEKVYELNKSIGGPNTQRIWVYENDTIGRYGIELQRKN